jgi:energy-coupling factor transporter ATP-binding protein EcfA2
MATGSENHDIRALLNAGERSVVALAWFLALHLLQPAADRRVLVLDDPFALLDVTNQAAALETLRVFVRLTQPEQFIFSTNDENTAQAVLSELTKVDEWPERVAEVRLARGSDDASCAEYKPETAEPAALGREIERLGVQVDA